MSNAATESRISKPAAASLRRPTVAIVTSTIVVLGGFLIAAAYGANSARLGERVLPQFEPVADAIRTYGGLLTAWALKNGPTLRLWVCGGAGVVLILGLIAGRLRGLPLLLLCGAVALAACGQTLLLAPQDSPALWYYLGALVVALLFGVWCPAPAADSATQAKPRWWIDALLVVALGLLGVATRLFSLTELPSFVAGEMSGAMLSSRTLAGILQFIPGALLGTSIGLAHLFPQMASFQLFGASLYSLRLTAVAVSIVTLLLFYWLLRSLAGRRAAVIGTLLLVAAPEQLWWSRSENVNYIMVCFAGVVSASLGWWMRRTLSVRSAIAVAAWVPFGRFFYLAAIMLVTYPWLLVGHALIFTRGAWRQLVRLVPVLVAGTVLWILSLSIVNFIVTEQPWHFLNPVAHGELVSRRNIEGRDASVADLVRLQAASLARNVSMVSSAFTYRGWFSQWYQRNDTLQNPTWINVAVSAVVGLSVAYVLGQLYTAQASVLLGWLLVGLLPAILSTAPDDRRMAVSFPALYASAGFAIDAALRVIRQRCGRITAWLTGAAVAAGLGAMLLSSLSSHFLLRTLETSVTRAQHLTAEIFANSDAIYYDGDGGAMELMLLGHADGFLAQPPCVEFLGPHQWLNAALRQPCSFEDSAFRLTMWPQQIEALKRAYRPPRRVSFLLSKNFRSRPAQALLQSLFPEVTPQELTTADEGLSMTAITVDRALLDARRQPVLLTAADTVLAAGFEAKLLADVTVQRQTAAPGELPPGELRVEGGMLVEREGWYRLVVSPACAAARVTIDGQTFQAADLPRPLLAGVHPFELRLGNADACATPLTLNLHGVGVGGAETVEQPALVSPMVAALPTVRAPAAALYAGYTDAGLLEGVRGRLLDARGTPDGRVVVLSRVDDGLLIQRFSAEGELQTSWDVAVPRGINVFGMALSRDAEPWLLTEAGAWLFDADGKLLSHWEKSPIHNPEVVFLRDGRIAACIPEHGSIEVFRRDGTRDLLFENIAADGQRFLEPMSLAMDEQGNIVVGQTDGTMVMLRTPLDRFEPTYVGQFRMDFTLPSVLPRSLTFDGPERILAGDPERMRVFVQAPTGVRLMAADPKHDWAEITQQTGEVRRLVPTPKYLYVLGGEASLRRFTR